jgi:hypothetical protein
MPILTKNYYDFCQQEILTLRQLIFTVRTLRSWLQFRHEYFFQDKFRLSSDMLYPVISLIKFFDREVFDALICVLRSPDTDVDLSAPKTMAAEWRDADKKKCF